MNYQWLYSSRILSSSCPQRIVTLNQSVRLTRSLSSRGRVQCGHGNEPCLDGATGEPCAFCGGVWVAQGTLRV